MAEIIYDVPTQRKYASVQTSSSTTEKGILKMRIKPVAPLLFMATSAMSLADPAPFGLEIGKSTTEEVREKVACGMRPVGISPYSGGEVYEICVSNIAFEGLQKSTVVFSKDGKLLVVESLLALGKFDYLFDTLSQKYKVISKETSEGSGKSAVFDAGNTEITILENLLFTKMTYVSKELINATKNQSKNQREIEKSQL